MGRSWTVILLSDRNKRDNERLSRLVCMLEHAQHVTKRETNFRKRYDRVKSCTNIYDTCSVFVPIVSTIVHVSLAFLSEKCYAKNASSAFRILMTLVTIFSRFTLTNIWNLAAYCRSRNSWLPRIFPFKMKWWFARAKGKEKKRKRRRKKRKAKRGHGRDTTNW